MAAKILVITPVVIFILMACQAEQAINPDTAQTLARDAWRQEWHAVWEIDWAAMPVGGPVTVEVWRAGERYRYEILEAAAPALIGETLVFDGRQAWRYNRFETDSLSSPAAPHLAPMSEAGAVIDRLLAEPPRSARRRVEPLHRQSTQRITLTFADESSLSVWIAQETGLPLRLRWSTPNAEGTLTARETEPLPDPPAGLFNPTIDTR